MFPNCIDRCGRKKRETQASTANKQRNTKEKNEKWE